MEKEIIIKVWNEEKEKYESILRQKAINIDFSYNDKLGFLQVFLH